MCVISLCTRGALDAWSRGRSTAALGVGEASSVDLISSVRRRALDPKTRTDQTDVYVPDIGRKLSESEVSAIERRLKLEFPETLRRLYSEIGDGGFGPGYGFLAMSKAQDPQ